MEVLRKMMTVILNHRLGTAIAFHDFLHIFRTGRIMGTSYINTKLLQYLEAVREEIIYEILLDLQTEYNYLDRESCIDILMGYGVVPRAIRLLW